MFKNKNNNRKHKNITVDTEFGTFKISIENMATKYCTNKQLILKLTTQLLRSLQSKNGIPQIWKNKFCCCLLISLNSDSKCTLKLIFDRQSLAYFESKFIQTALLCIYSNFKHQHLFLEKYFQWCDSTQKHKLETKHNWILLTVYRMLRRHNSSSFPFPTIINFRSVKEVF